MSRFLSRTTLSHLRLVGPLAVVAALGIGSLPALAQSTTTATPPDCSAMHFELANPGPGSRVEQGNIVVQGVATDNRATDGMGIDRIEFFLDNRDDGGVNIGTFAPGMVAGPFGPGSFQTTISFPETNGGHDLFAYAHSSVTGQESIIEFPIAVGEDVAETSATTATETCTQGGTTAPAMTTPAASTTPAAETPANTVATPVAAMAPSTASLVLDVANPSPDDTVHVGALNIQGAAWDKAAESGSGVDHIDIFLDNRDDGGILLTQVHVGELNNWTAHVTLPANQTGLHTLAFYAHSSVTSHEVLVSVPVNIED